MWCWRDQPVKEVEKEVWLGQNFWLRSIIPLFFRESKNKLGMTRARSIENTISKEKLVSGRSEFNQAFMTAIFFREGHFFEFGFIQYFYKERVTR